MNKDDLILVSADDHVVEPPDVFAGHLPTKYREFAPTLRVKVEATVGALRAQAAGHDIAVRSMGRGNLGAAALDIGGMSKLATGR